MTKARCLAIGVLAVLAAGCSALSGIDNRYPAEWPVVSTESGCPDITGDFANRGNYSYSPLGGSHFLAFQLDIPLTNHQFSVVEHVRIQWIKDGEFLVEALSSSNSIAQKQLSLAAGDFSCDTGALVFPSKSETNADGFGVAAENRVLLLRRASDGSIIGEERSSVAALAMYVVPMGGVQTFWYRWLPQ